MRRHKEKAKTKRAIHLSIRGDLLRAARDADIDVSAVLEQALLQELAEGWRRKNRGAIAAYNEFVQRHGIFSGGLGSL
jgi:antitoxin CcdA